MMTLNEKYMRGQKPDFDILAYNLDGFWIAGGSIRRWFTGEKQNSDIDIFCNSDNVVDNLCVKLNLTTDINNERYITFKNSPIQIIINPKFVSMEECINHFDFTICQFAWDGQRIIATQDAIISTLRHHLAVNEIQPGFEVDSLRRAFKYANAGYQPCMGTIRDMAISLQREEIDINKQVEISPGGKMRIPKWD